jgi:hypothetical protein
MSSTSDQIYSKFQSVVKTVKTDLAKKGVAIPVKNADGTVRLEQFTIIKESSGFYAIKDRHGDLVIDKINLPQTAALLANGLALGRWIDKSLYNIDQEYGYKLFEEELFKRNGSRNLKNKNVDRADMLFTKSKIAHGKVERAKREILSSFEKLRNLN